MECSRPEHWNTQPFPSPGDLPNPGIEPKSLSLQVNSLPAEPQGSPRILEWQPIPSPWIFLIQELNRGLLHCRQILYQLSYQGSPKENEIMPLAAMWMDPEITKLSEVSQKEKDKIPLLLFSH